MCVCELVKNEAYQASLFWSKRGFRIRFQLVIETRQCHSVGGQVETPLKSEEY